MIIDRARLKKIVLWAALALLLTLGSYYILHGGQSSEKATKADNPVKSTRSANQDVASGFCSRYRMERQQVRGQEISMLNGVANGAGGDSQARGKAMQRLVEISSNMENEMKIENLVRCRGARDCVAMVEADSVTLVIAASPMKEKQASDIEADLRKITGCREEQISLIFRER